MKKQLTPIEAKALIDYLCKLPMSNYGYSASDWSRVVAQRQRAKNAVATLFLNNKVKLMKNINIEWLGNSSLQSANGHFDFIVGISANEEITNVLRRIANPNARYLS